MIFQPAKWFASVLIQDQQLANVSITNANQKVEITSRALRHTVAFGDFFLQKKHITAIKRKILAEFSQICSTPFRKLLLIAMLYVIFLSPLRLLRMEGYSSHTAQKTSIIINVINSYFEKQGLTPRILTLLSSHNGIHCAATFHFDLTFAGLAI